MFKKKMIKPVRKIGAKDGFFICNNIIVKKPFFYLKKRLKKQLKGKIKKFIPKILVRVVSFLVSLQKFSCA